MGKFSVAILTYGDRYVFLSKVLDSLLAQKFSVIYVFCNGLESQRENHLRENYSDSRIKYLSSVVNLGSAGGYHQLLQYIYRHDKSDYLLLLDDDNLLGTDFLSQISKFPLDSRELLLFNRPDRILPLRAVKENNPRLIMGPEAGFLGHSVFGYTVGPGAHLEGDLLAAPYGGLLMPAAVYESKVLPDEKLFLYGDDYDFTFRLCSAAGFKIRFVQSPSIIDLEKSFHLNKAPIYALFSNRYVLANENQLFFSVRNQVYLSWRDSHCKVCAFINLTLFFPIYVSQFLVRGQLMRAWLFVKAVSAGLRLSFREIL